MLKERNSETLRAYDTKRIMYYLRRIDDEAVQARQVVLRALMSQTYPARTHV